MVKIKTLYFHYFSFIFFILLNKITILFFVKIAQFISFAY